MTTRATGKYCWPRPGARDLRPRREARGSEALVCLRQAAAGGEAFAVVVLDTETAGFGGLHGAAAIRGDERLKATRIVLLAASPEQIGPEDLARLDISACLVKPVSQAELFDALGAALRRRGGPGSMPLAHLRGHVLLAEDNDSNLIVARAHLERAGLKVSSVSDGEQALAMLAAEHFDLVLMDCQMPFVDGFAATQTLRQRELGTGRHVPVIALTANAMPGDRERCLAAGMDDYLSKPYSGEEMLAILYCWLPAEAIASVLPAPLDPLALDKIRALSPDKAEQLVGQLLKAYLKAATQEMTRLEHAMQCVTMSSRWRAPPMPSNPVPSTSGARRFGELLGDIEASAQAADRVAIRLGREVLVRRVVARQAGACCPAGGRCRMSRRLASVLVADDDPDGCCADAGGVGPGFFGRGR